MSRIRILGIGSPSGDDQAGWLVVDALAETGVGAELRKLDRPGATLVGTSQKTVKDALGNPQSVASESYPGTYFEAYHSDAQIGSPAVTNPFLSGGVFDFAHYLAANSIALAPRCPNAAAQCRAFTASRLPVGSRPRPAS